MTDKHLKKRGLGRGLSALMSDVKSPVTDFSGETNLETSVLVLPIEKIYPNPDQPRRRFEASDLDELTESIRAKGVIQPLIVRKKDEEMYEIVAGERRWRAAQQANIHELPVLVRDFTDTEVLEVAIIENIQRADLNPIEEAVGYRQLMERFGHTQEQLAEALGKSRSHIANLLRLLNLPDEVLSLVREGRLSAGHARALITAGNPMALARKVINLGLSVRQTESLVKRDGESLVKSKKAGKSRALEKDADTRALEQELSTALGMKVEVNHQEGMESGKIIIDYRSMEQLDTLCRHLGGL